MNGNTLFLLFDQSSSLTFPTDVALRKFKKASVNLVSANNSFIDVLPGPALDLPVLTP